MTIARTQPAHAARAGRHDNGRPAVSVLDQRRPLTSDDLLFRDAVGRLLVLHELKKAGALSYDEFNALKARLLDL
jgi:hypothetical protein